MNKPLPPYRAVLVVDIKDYSREPGADQQGLSESVPVVLRDTFTRIGHGALWEEVSFHDSTGDGYTLGLSTRHLPLLIGEYLTGLQEELADRHAMAVGRAAMNPVRMRVSLTVGPLTDSGRNALGDGKGESRVEAHRLVDAAPLKALLQRTNPTITFVAAILSERVFTDVVAAGYCSLRAAEFHPAPVRVKQYESTGYLYLPRQSGEVLAEGLFPAPAPVAEAEDAAGPAPEPPAAPGGRGAVGRVRDVGGTVITAPDGPVQTGDGQQISGQGFRVSGGISNTVDKRGHKP
ncbi:hypothetical protein JOF53_006930 [Crossiella equi]|uniref:Guanylate cyclase domain-containing protein n=1 Tax=Crossiella equi TaxID=130796 RepID=A0ABS5ANA6_9PSEU|nr:hypothetical protein [Crossiella equi]MBP2478058.1 hypothetical protein [Crossiella equi]